MNGWKRFRRRPVATLVWLAVITAAALLLSAGSGVLWSVIGLQEHMDQQFISIAVLTRTEEQVEELEQKSKKGGVLLGTVPFAPTLSADELAQISAMDQVRLVDLRGLTAAYSPSLDPVLSVETDKAYRVELDRPYGRVVLVGRVIEAETERTTQKMDTTAQDGHVHECTVVNTKGRIAVEQVVSAHAAYTIADEINLGLNYVSEDPDDQVRTGERYLFYGEYDAGLLYDQFDYIMESSGLEREKRMPWMYVDDGLPYASHHLQEDGSYRFVSSGDVEPRFPSFTRLEGSVEDFLSAPENELWQKTLDEMEITLHSLPLLGTDCLESVFAFQQGSSYIIQGRSFTQQEYRTGAPVCVISEAAAQKAGLSVGDSLPISQYETVTNYSAYSSLGPYYQTSVLLQRNQSGGYTELNDPFISPYLSQYGFATENESFTVVGIYRQETWWDHEGAYAMTPNVIFAPSGALAECAYRSDAGGVYLSVLLKNGSIQDFEQAIEGTGLEGRWFLDDQNYASVKAGVEQLKSTALILMVACLAGWLVVVAFYLVLYQGGERRSLGIMLSVGAGKKRAVRYLFGSGVILAAVGTVLGVVLGQVVDQSVLDMALSVSMGQAEATAMSSGAQIDTALIAEALTESGAMGWQGAVLMAAISITVLAAAMLIQALVLARRRPRKLMEG